MIQGKGFYREKMDSVVGHWRSKEMEIQRNDDPKKWWSKEIMIQGNGPHKKTDGFSCWPVKIQGNENSKKCWPKELMTQRNDDPKKLWSKDMVHIRKQMDSFVDHLLK